MKIGILTFHRALNCGAMLQAWALKTVLERMGHDVVYPVDTKNDNQPRWLASAPKNRRGWLRMRGRLGAFVINMLSVGIQDLNRFRFRRFLKRHLPEKWMGSDTAYRSLDALIIGSDMVWWPKLHLSDNRRYFAQGADSHVRLVSYAASIGDHEVDSGILNRIADFSRRAIAVSVREEYLKRAIVDACDKPVDVVVDPTLLVGAADYECLAEGAFPCGDYLFYYGLNLSAADMARARKLAKLLKVRLVAHSVYQNSLYHAPRGLTYAISPDRFIQLMSHAKYVLASSFHATVFPLIFRKRFTFLETCPTGRSRSSDLLRQLKMEDWIATQGNSADDIAVIMNRDLPGDIGMVMDELRKSSVDFLNRHLGGFCQVYQSVEA